MGRERKLFTFPTPSLILSSLWLPLFNLEFIEDSCFHVELVNDKMNVVSLSTL